VGARIRFSAEPCATCEAGAGSVLNPFAALSHAKLRSLNIKQLDAPTELSVRHVACYATCSNTVMADSGVTAQNVAELLAFLQYAETFPNYPKGFIPPSFTDKNYVPPYRGTSVLVTALVMMSLALISVLARLWVRRFQNQRAWGPDDWAMIPALVSIHSKQGRNAKLGINFGGLV
jgi:hypothetical protein